MEPSGWQVTDTRDEPEPEQRGHGKDVIGEPAGVGILLRDLPPGLVHQKPVQNVGCLAHGGRNVLGRKGAELVGDMGIGLEARLGAVFRVDEVHGFALPGGGEELPVAGRGHATTPKRGHGQLGLRLDHHGEGLVDGVALHMPSRQAGELEVIMRVGRLGHLAEPEVQAFGQL